MTDPLRAAQRVGPVFDHERLVAARELLGLTQAELASRADITPSALSQIERGSSRPTAANLTRLAEELTVPVEGLARRPRPATDLNPQFRHLRRTPQRERRKALRLVEATNAVSKVLASHVDLPSPMAFTRPIDPDAPIADVQDEVEHAALATRHVLGASSDAPLDPHWIVILERHGVVVVRDPETDKDIDAYSAVVDDLPIVILDGGSQSVWDRDNFNLAHELGHLIMHRDAEHRPGTRTVESQAHRFAGAFLAPKEAIRPEIPRDLDWKSYLALKARWGVSMAALIRRARDLDVIDDEKYARAMKQRSAYGWRTVEPGNELRPQPTPTLLSKAADIARLSIDDIANRAGIPTAVAKRIIGEGQRPAVVP